MKYSTSLRNARSDLIATTAGSGAKYKYYNGTESFTPAGTLLATLTVTGAFQTGASAGGVMDVNETVTQTKASHVTGTPTFVLVTTSADVPVMTLTVGTDITFLGTITTGVDITFNASTMTEGNA